jgi:serine/threonine protein kinase/tetratricopeptide (TPR) repeat protein
MNERDMFEAALELPPESRGTYLDGACGSDAALRQRLEALLGKHDRAGSFLEVPAVPALALADEPAASEQCGTLIGPYKLLEQIGEGGFGVVFMAEQQQPIRRKVALKVLKPGMDTRQIIARFEAERQALALMEHPNIAQVFDGGETASGRPYFVMELVKGMAITDYCDQDQLMPRQRLELFLPVCQAVRHAHQKGVIHRDLKPSNLLVTRHDGTPVVKVIDFGIAKATGQQLTDKTLFTGFAQLIGTPLYLSPEQAALSGLDVDTRSDIYSLGVVLYELLTGTTPFDRQRFQEVDYDEMRRIIREEEPPRPSTRLSTLGLAATTVSTQRRSDRQRLSRLFRGELDWIVMKCLEKDRNRRYETASELAQDIERYLHDEPVKACPPSALYRFRKFARRHVGALTVAGLVLFSLVSLAGGIGWVFRDREARQLILERDVTTSLKEVAESYKAERLPQAFAALKEAEGLLAGGGGSAELHERVREWRQDLEMVERLDKVRGQQANVRGRNYAIGDADSEYAALFRRYGIDVEALDSQEAARRLSARPIRPKLVEALEHWLQVRKEALRAPEKAWRPLLDILRATDPDDYRDQVRTALLNRDHDTLLRLTQPERLSGLPVVTALYAADVLRWTGTREESVELLRQVQRQHPGDFWANWHLAANLALTTPPRLDEVLRFYSAALAARPENAELHVNIGAVLFNQGKVDEAIAEYRTAIARQPERALGYYYLAQSLRFQGHLEEAIEPYRKAAALAPDWWEAQWDLGQILHINGRYIEALPYLKHAHKPGARDPTWTKPAERLSKEADLLAALEAKLPDFESGKAKPASKGERLALAQTCFGRKNWLQAARWYVEAIGAHPEILGDQPSDPRYSAARAAVLSACSRGDGHEAADDAERARFRRLALNCLKSELAAWRLFRTKEQDHAVLVVRLQHWQKTPDLAGVREAAALARLPAAERPDWQKLWQDVEELRRATAQAATSRH